MQFPIAFSIKAKLHNFQLIFHCERIVQDILALHLRLRFQGGVYVNLKDEQESLVLLVMDKVLPEMS